MICAKCLKSNIDEAGSAVTREQQLCDTCEPPLGEGNKSPGAPGFSSTMCGPPSAREVKLAEEVNDLKAQLAAVMKLLQDNKPATIWSDNGNSEQSESLKQSTSSSLNNTGSVSLNRGQISSTW